MSVMVHEININYITVNNNDPTISRIPNVNHNLITEQQFAKDYNEDSISLKRLLVDGARNYLEQLYVFWNL